jgi:hypothetical protein
MVGVNCLEVAFHQLFGSMSSTKEIKTSFVFDAIVWSPDNLPIATVLVAERVALGPVGPISP